MGRVRDAGDGKGIHRAFHGLALRRQSEGRPIMKWIDDIREDDFYLSNKD